MSNSHVKRQKAERDINNVTGNQYNFENVVMELVSDDDTNKLDIRIKELDHVNYLSNLQEEMSAKNIVLRESFISNLTELIEEQGEVLLVGQPGMGKTVILNELAINRNAEYISLKGKSIERVIKYFIKTYELPIKDLRKDEMLDLLESFLYSNPKYFLIDDCETSTEIVNELLSIEKSKSKFVYASRTSEVAKSRCIQVVDVPKFKKDEIKKFLKLEEIELDELHINMLIKASEGNPLYLYYLSKHQITPLPTGLYNYQEALWRNLSNDNQENLLCIATSCFPIRFKVLKKAYERICCNKSVSPMYFNNLLSDIGYLCKSHDQKIDIFHLSFKEFIIEKIKELGMGDYYVKIVGNAYFEEGNYIDSTILLINLLDGKVKPYIFESAHVLFHRGYIDISYNLLSKAIEIFDEEKECFEIGYAHYHLSNISREITSEDYIADDHIDQAIEIFEKLKEEKLLYGALAFKALNLAESGRKQESLTLVDRITENIPEDRGAKALTFVNLSKLYLIYNQYKKSAKYAKNALEIFVELDDTYGIQISILNLSGCLSNINEEELAVDYLEDLLHSDQIKLSQRVKAGVLNNLTSCYRKKESYEKAKECCRESIQIGQQLGLDKVVSMNMLNLGNIYRDEENYNECEKIYWQAIHIAEDCNNTQTIGRGYELIANIYVSMEKFEEAIEMAEKAIESSTLIKNSFRVAEAYYEKVKAELALNRPQVAIKDLSKSVDSYLKEGFIDESIYCLIEGIDIAKKNSLVLAKSEFMKKLDNLINSDNKYCPNDCITNLKDFEGGFEINECLDLYERIIMSSLRNNMNITAYSLIDVIDYFERHKFEGGRESFIRVLSNLKNSMLLCNQYSGLLAVGLGIPNNLLELKDIEVLVKGFVSDFEGFYYRELNSGDVLFTLCLENDVIIELYSTQIELFEYKTAVALSIILSSTMSQIVSADCKFQVKNIRIYSYNYYSFNHGGDNIIEKDMFDSQPVLFPQWTGEGNIITYILAPDYGDRKNGFLWLVMKTYLSILSIIEDITIEDADKAYAKKVSDLVRRMILNIDYSSSEDWLVEL